MAQGAVPNLAARREAGSADELLDTRPPGHADITLDRGARLVGDRGQLPRAVANAVGALSGRRFDGEQAGRLILWHGVPGTGKTHALRALAWEWRRWCDFHYVTDPEELFGSPKYMLDVLLDEDDDDSGWRLLILEDTGELLALDAGYQSGQGLSGCSTWSTA